MSNPLSSAAQRRARELTEAAAAGDAARVESLLAAGARADAPTRDGETPLMRAAALGYEDVARALLEAGADTSARRGDGFTPLMLAVFFGHERLVRLLLTYGADANAPTRLGTTPAAWAAARGFAEIATLLGSAGTLGTQSAAPRRRPSAADAPRVGRSIGAGEGSASRELVAATGSNGGGAAREQTDASRKDSAGVGEKDSVGKNDSVGERDLDGAAVAALHVSVRRDGQVPAHPSASSFGLSGFMRSWQASVGTALLLVAVGVAGYAAWRGGKTPQANTRPAPVSPSPAPQTLAQPPAPGQPAAVPTPDAQNGLLTPGANGAAYPTTAPPGQIFYAPPVAPIPGQAGLPTTPAVISESDVPSPEDSSKSKRKNDNSARNAPSAAQPAANRDDAARDPAARADSAARDARPPAPEPQPAPPARQTQPAPAPQPSSTPERGKVIPWPPQ